MYQSQVRPDTCGRELVAKQQPKQHPSDPRSHRNSTQTIHSFLQSSSRSRSLRSGLLALAAICVISALSACGGVTFRPTSAVKASSGTSSTTPALSQISCGTKSLTGAQTKACSVYVSTTASVPTAVALSTSNAALQVPTAVTIAAGAKSAGFNVVSSVVTKELSVTISGASDGVTKTDVLTLYPPATSASSLSKVSCGTQTLTGPTTKACSVYLSAATESQITVSLSSSNSALQVPGSVTVPAGATTGGFSVTASAVTTTENVTLTASANGVSQTEVIQLDGSGGTQTAQHHVQLNWEAPSATSVPITGYNVYRATSGSSNYALLNAGLDAATTYTDSTVASGQTYDYVVKSVDSSGVESSPSNSTAVTVP